MLNAPSNDVMGAYDEIQRHFNQLPGQGEIITNISLGDLDDAGAAASSTDPCNFWVSVFGPTTEMIGGQRYIDWPSMPLIATYTADGSGNLNGAGEVCGTDPYLGEVGLDFSMMAPLPSQAQRAAARGSGLTDLFGIAPGAQYRLVVPADPASTMTEIDAAFIAAATQNPRPNVITASLGFGLDIYGFPSRYLEDDPLSEAVIASIVQNDRITVCVSANDGTREFTYASIGPSGGSVATNLVPAGGTPTNLNDVAYSTTPSLDFDSGAIDVGGTTLDDIFSNPPQWTDDPHLQAQHAYPETRWTGFTSFSSGFGSRVNVSAPSDNVIAFVHDGSSANSVAVAITGGTSASAPEVAAAAAVVQQVARLTGHPFSDPVAVRSFLASTGTPVPPVAQADTNVNVGPQLDLRRAIEALLVQAGIKDAPSVPRVAIEQRRPFANEFDDGMFVTYTDPANIDLQGDALFGPGPQNNDGADQKAWITIAPDWEFVSAATTYRLSVAGTNKVLAVTPWARLLPDKILAAAGLPVKSSSNRTVNLTYTANSPGRYSIFGAPKALSVRFSLTFGPSSPASCELLAPNVAPVVNGNTISVTYDISDFWSSIPNPGLTVTEPGRVNDAAVSEIGAMAVPSVGYHPPYTVPLTQPKGTVQVPVSALQGGGIYGIVIGQIQPYPPPPPFFQGAFSDFAYTRVAPQHSDARPPAPLLSANGSLPGHYLDVPYNGTFQLTYDVSNVPGATGATLEVSAAGPVIPASGGVNLNTFNNPNGSERDHDGIDTGSVSFVPLSGAAGTVTLNAKDLGLYSAMYHTIRVLPTSGSVAAGEAGDISMITMDGVVPADGGSLGWGYGINPNGNDAFLTSNQAGYFFVNGQIEVYGSGSLETFDQTTNAISQTVRTTSGNIFISPVGAIRGGGGFGMHANDVGLFATARMQTIFDFFSPTFTYGLLNPAATGNDAGAWAPPNSQPLLLDAPNFDTGTSAFLTGYFARGPYSIFASNIAQNTSGTPVDITAKVSDYSQPEVWGLAQDTQSNLAVAAAFDFGNLAGAPRLITVDLAGGTVDSFAGVGFGTVAGVALDSSRHVAAVPMSNLGTTQHDYGVGIYNVPSKSGFQTMVPGAFLWTGRPVADPLHHLFLVADALDEDIFPGRCSTCGELQDLNEISGVVVLDENGNIVERIRHFNLTGGFSTFGAYLQINPARRTGYLVGPGKSQLATFTY